MMSNISENTDLPDAVTVVLAADDNYVMPMAVTLRSLIDAHRTSRNVHIYVLDDGIGETNKGKLLRSVRDPRLELRFVSCAQLKVPPLRSAGLHGAYSSRAALFRLFLAALLPQHLKRVVYLDSDLLVIGEIDEIWDTILETDMIAAAVQDAAVPFHDSLRGSATTPLLRQTGRPYFNSGVMLIDLDRWRQQDIGGRTQALMETTEHPLPFIDQDALNVILSGAWQPLDPAWNCPSEYHFRGWKYAGYGNLLPYRDVTPKIIHFCSSGKPWHSTYPFVSGIRLYMDCLDKTDWKGWRPHLSAIQRAKRVLRQSLPVWLLHLMRRDA